MSLTLRGLKRYRKNSLCFMPLLMTAPSSYGVSLDDPAHVPPTACQSNYIIYLTTRHQPALTAISKMVDMPGAILLSRQRRFSKVKRMAIILQDESHHTVNALLRKIHQISGVKLKSIETMPMHRQQL